MVSRKKLQGQARKAKATEKKRGPLFQLLKQLRIHPKNRSSITACTHGWSPNEFDSDHDCHKFVEVIMEITTKSSVAGTACSDVIDTTEHLYPEVWYHKESLEWIRKALVSIGASIILAKDDDREVFDCSIVIGLCEHIYQQLASTMYGFQPFCIYARVHDLLNADRRRLVSYIKKRIPCSCLDDKYKEVKALPKMGTCRYRKCSHLRSKVALSDMMSCERCRIQHYCSEQCQAADWQRHKENDHCKQWGRWRLNGGANK